MRDNTTKVLEEAYKQVVVENRLSQLQPEEIENMDPVELSRLTIDIRDFMRMSDEQIEALKIAAGKIASPYTANYRPKGVTFGGKPYEGPRDQTDLERYGLPNPNGGPNIPYRG